MVLGDEDRRWEDGVTSNGDSGNAGGIVALGEGVWGWGRSVCNGGYEDLRKWGWAAVGMGG